MRIPSWIDCWWTSNLQCKPSTSSSTSSGTQGPGWFVLLYTSHCDTLFYGITYCVVSLLYACCDAKIRTSCTEHSYLLSTTHVIITMLCGTHDIIVPGRSPISKKTKINTSTTNRKTVITPWTSKERTVPKRSPHILSPKNVRLTPSVSGWDSDTPSSRCLG